MVCTSHTKCHRKGLVGVNSGGPDKRYKVKWGGMGVFLHSKERYITEVEQLLRENALSLYKQLTVYTYK